MAIDYREHPAFIPDYTGELLPERPAVPISVCVLGTGEETCFLGFGNIIGSVEVDEDSCPVIELQDSQNGKSYTILGGSDCIWMAPPPEGVIEAVSRGRIAIESIANYIEQCDKHTAATEENTWLEENGIDPNSI
jgi:hypothetical protein